jgi:hypothetical protein
MIVAFRQSLKGVPSEQEGVGVGEQFAGVGEVLVVQVGKSPLMGRADLTAKRDMSRFDELSHLG